MTDTPHEQQPREPGVRYRQETRWRTVTTVIDGVPSTHEEPYFVDVPIPPKDWETLVERGLFVWAVVLVAVAFAGTCASVGGLFSELLHPGVAYALGVVFTGSWLGCMGLEWLDGRIDSTRVIAARVGGWVALLLGMGAVFVYGYSRGLPWVGAAGACLDLLAKGFCTLLLRRSQVELPRGVATWVRHQEEREAGRAVLAGKIGRLNRYAAYRRAVGGQEDRAAQAILAAAEGLARALPDASERRPDMSAMPSAPVQQSAPAPAAPVAPPAPASSPVSAAPVPSVPPVPPVEPSAPTSGPRPDASGQDPEEAEQEPPLPSVLPMVPSIRQIVIKALDEDEEISDEDLVARVREVHGDRPKLAETVATYRRKEMKKRRAS
ncbi:hypothetical protein [Streptomyces sp. TE5632]